MFVVSVCFGSNVTYTVNKNMARSFNKMWRKVTGRDYAHSPISLNDEQLRSLPTILVQCQVRADAPCCFIPLFAFFWWLTCLLLVR